MVFPYARIRGGAHLTFGNALPSGSPAKTGTMSNCTRTVGQARRAPVARPQFFLGYRALVALWLVCSVIYTPIHLALVSHGDETHSIEPGSGVAALNCFDHDDSHSDEQHAWHPSSQHSFEAVSSGRLVVISTPAILIGPWLDAAEVLSEPSEPPKCRSQGTSPPELIRGWQFHTRAAPPARAPSVLS